MKNQIATTREQSQRLIACGVNPDSADMCYVGGWSEVCAITFSKCNKEDTPAWSLSALLALLPNKILIDDAWYECQIYLYPFGCEVRYHSEVFKDPFGCLCNRPIEGCVSAIEYLIQNGYKLNKD